MHTKSVAGRRLLAGAVLMGAAFAPLGKALAAEEIIVTARRVEENIQEVPVAVTAFSSEQIQQLNIRNIDEIARFTPSFSFNSAFGRQPGSDRPAIRGVTTIQNGIGNAGAAAYFVDGIFLGGSPQSTELTNLERVEVIKGPQAAQFGRGTYAGAISFVTRKPSMDDWEGNVTLTGAEFGTVEAAGWVSAPIIEDKLAFFVAAGYNETDGAFDNKFALSGVPAGDKLGATEDTNVTGKLLWAPLEGLEITLKGGRQVTDDGHFPIYLQGADTLNCLKNRGGVGSGVAPRNRGYFCGDAQPNWDNMTVATSVYRAAGYEPGVRLDRNLGTLNIEYTDPDSDITFSSLTGYVDDRVRAGFDVSYAGYVGIPNLFQIDADESNVFTQELRVTSSQKERLRATGGVYLFRQEAEETENSQVVVGSQSAARPGNPFLIPPGTDLTPFRAPNCGGPGCRNLNSGNLNLTTNNVRNISIFGGVEYDITDRLTAGIEARYAEDRIEQSNVKNDGTGLNPDTPDFQDTFKAVTPRVTVRYQLTDDVNLYGNVSAGTKPGTFNAQVPDESFRSVDEEKLTAYEIGAKTQWFDRRLTANLAIYFNDIEDQQLTQNVEFGPPDNPQITSLIVNVGETEVWGVEIDTNLQITDNWNAGLVYSYTDSEITKRLSTDEADLQGWNGDPDTYAEFADVAGRTSPRIPTNQAAAFTRYDIPFSWGGLYVGADVTYEGSRYAQEDNLIETGDRTVVGARVGARYGNWDLNLWVRNLTDDDAPIDVLRYIDQRGGSLTSCNAVLGAPASPPAAAIPACAGSSSSARGFALTPQQPRQYGATLNYRFGKAQ